jgi:hypothetical protein
MNKMHSSGPVPLRMTTAVMDRQSDDERSKVEQNAGATAPYQAPSVLQNLSGHAPYEGLFLHFP